MEKSTEENISGDSKSLKRKRSSQIKERESERKSVEGDNNTPSPGWVTHLQYEDLKPFYIKIGLKVWLFF